MNGLLSHSRHKLVGVAASSILATAMLFAGTGLATATSGGCLPSTSNGQICLSVNTPNSSSYTINSETVRVTAYGFAAGYIHWGVIINGTWHQTAVTGPYTLLKSSVTVTNSSMESCYLATLTIYGYAWWQPTGGGDPTGGYAILIKLPA